MRTSASRVKNCTHEMFLMKNGLSIRREPTTSNTIFRSAGKSSKASRIERKIVFDVVGSLRIESPFFIRNISCVQFFTRDADVLIELEPLCQPVIEQLH